MSVSFVASHGERVPLSDPGSMPPSPPFRPYPFHLKQSETSASSLVDLTVTWKNMQWSHCHQKYPWTGVTFHLTFLFPLALPWSMCVGSTRDAPSAFWRVSELNSNLQTLFYLFFLLHPLRGWLKTVPSTDLSPWGFVCRADPELTVGNRGQFSLTLAQTLLWLSSKYIQNCLKTLKRALSACLSETSLLQRLGQWSLCPHCKCRALLCVTRSNNWIKSICKGRAKERSAPPSRIGPFFFWDLFFFKVWVMNHDKLLFRALRSIH